MAKWSSQHNGKYPDPYSKLKFNDEKKKEKKKKKQKREREHRENILTQIDSNANKVGDINIIHKYTECWKGRIMCYSFWNNSDSKLRQNPEKTVAI